MAKAALNMMTRTSACEYAEHHIYMNSVDTGTYLIDFILSSVVCVCVCCFSLHLHYHRNAALLSSKDLVSACVFRETERVAEKQRNRETENHRLAFVLSFCFVRLD